MNGIKRSGYGAEIILLLLKTHLGGLDITHDDVAHLELFPIAVVVGPDLNALCRGIVLVDDDVVVVVIELILIASAYMRIRHGFLLEVIVIARCNAADAIFALGVPIAFATLGIAQDDPADGIAVVGLYGDARALCGLIDGTVARAA